MGKNDRFQKYYNAPLKPFLIEHAFNTFGFPGHLPTYDASVC